MSKNELKEILKNFDMAFWKLIMAFDDMPDDLKEKLFLTDINDSYPFHMDIDEIYFETSTWIEKLIENI